MRKEELAGDRSGSFHCQAAVPLQPVLAHTVDTHRCTWTDPGCHLNSAEPAYIRLGSPSLSSHDDLLMQNKTCKMLSIDKNNPEKQ